MNERKRAAVSHQQRTKVSEDRTPKAGKPRYLTDCSRELEPLEAVVTLTLTSLSLEGGRRRALTKDRGGMSTVALLMRARGVTSAGYAKKHVKV